MITVPWAYYVRWLLVIASLLALVAGTIRLIIRTLT